MNFTSNPITRFILDSINHGLERSARRWYSVYQGYVAKAIDGKPGNVDPRAQGRVFVNVPDLGIGQTDAGRTTFISADLPQSALPVSPYAGKDHGFYFPPEVGDSVWVTFEYGDVHQPKYLGGWWGNTSPGDKGTDKTSELPSEFRNAPSLPPTTRGIKTGRGHALLFEDSSSNPYVSLWCGKSNPGSAADQHQVLILSDDPSAAGASLETFYGHILDMSDTNKKITLSGKPIGTLANSVEIDDLAKKITIKSANPAQSVVIDGTTMAITVTNPGVTTINSIGPVSISSAAAATIGAIGGIALGSGVTGPPIPTPGMMVEEGAGAKISAFAGDVTETVAGAFTQNVTGLFAQNVLGLMSVSAAALSLTAAVLTLTGNIIVTGTAQFGSGPPQQLLHQQIIDLLVNHKHPTGVGPTGNSPDLAVLGTSAVPATAYVTSDLRGS